MTETNRKVAVVINGDTEARHQENVERSLVVLEQQGYEVFVLNRGRPKGVAPDHFFLPTRQGLQQLQQRLNLTAGVDTDLVLYTTGHGDLREGDGALCLEDGCHSEAVVSALDSLLYGRRTVIMDQCFSGNWNKVFLDDPTTLFIAAGSKDETTCCQEIAPRFWSDMVPDANGDGTTSWQERYAYAVADRALSSAPQFVASEGYRMDGRPPFPAEVVEVEDGKALQDQLKHLKPGQYAVITFSASWCSPCQDYRPRFDRMAAEDGGQHLWLRTENEELAKEWDVAAYPTVVIVDDAGHRVFIERWDERNDISRTLANFTLPAGDRLLARAEAARNIPDEYLRYTTLLGIAVEMSHAGRTQESLSIFNEFISWSNNYADALSRVSSLTRVASAMEKADMWVEALRPLEMAVGAAALIGDDRHRRDVLDTIIAILKHPNELAPAISPLFSDETRGRVLRILDASVAIAKEIPDASSRAYALQAIGDGALSFGLGHTSLTILERAATAAREIPSPLSRSSQLAHIGELFVKAGKPNRALAVLKGAAAAARAIPDPYERSVLLRDVGVATAHAGQQVRAAALFQMAVAAAGDTPSGIVRYSAVGWILQGLKRADVGVYAALVLETLIAPAEGIRDAILRSYALRDIGLALSQAGQPERAIDVFGKAVLAVRGFEKARVLSGALQGICTALNEAKVGEVALPVFMNLVAVAGEIQDTQARAEALRAIRFWLIHCGLEGRIDLPE